MGAGEAGSRLNALLERVGLAALDGQTTAKFQKYLSLYLRWNERLNLSAIRDEEGALSIHIIESIVVASELPRGVETLLDFGSGAGLPGIPIALCRPEIRVTLAESQGKKAAFLREAVRMLGITTKVHAQRAETLRTTFDCVVLRAVDRMHEAVASAVRLVKPAGWMALMTTVSDFERLKGAAGREFSWVTQRQLPGGVQRMVAFGSRDRAGASSTESE